MIVTLLLAILAQPGPGQWEASSLRPVPAATGEGSCLASLGNGEDLFLICGSASKVFLHYSIAGDAWTPLAPLPFAAGRGDSLVSPGGVFLYASFSQGGFSAEFWRYTIPMNLWERMEPAPSAFNSGNRLVAVGSSSIYATTTRTDPNKHGSPVSRYDIAADEWIGVGDLTFDAFSGTATVYDGGDTIYLTRGSYFQGTWSPEVAAFSISTGTTSSVRSCGHGFGYGASLLNPGFGGYLYGCTGGSGTIGDPDADLFWAYAPAADQWYALADAPGPMQVGASLAYGGTGAFVYAVPGSSASPAPFWRYRIDVDPPVIHSLAQRKLDDATALAVGTATLEAGFTANAVASDPNGVSFEIQVEVQEVGTAFTGSTPHVRAVTTGAVSIPVTGLAIGRAYHWQVRAVNARGGLSAWMPFGGNPEGEPDFRTRTNTAPSASGAAQRLVSTGTPLPSGGRDDSNGVRLEVFGSDLENDPMIAEFEIRPVGIAFTGSPTAADRLGAGGVGSVVASGGAQRLHWQVRVVDSLGAAGSWTPYGGNGENETDFELMSFGSVGGGCLGSAGLRGAVALLALVLLFRR